MCVSAIAAKLNSWS